MTGIIQLKQIITEIMGRELRVRLFPIIISLKNTFSFYIKDPGFLALSDANTLLPIILTMQLCLEGPTYNAAVGNIKAGVPH